MEKDMRRRIIRRTGARRDKWSFREKLIVQMMFCGLLLAAAMLFNISGSMDIREAFKSALAKDYSPWKAEAEPDSALEAEAGVNIGVGVSIDLEQDDLINQKNDEARIDEDILNEINNSEDPYINGN